MQLQVYSSIKDIAESDWQTWFGGDYPFLHWRFLRGLEESGCTDQASGWIPCHCVLRDGDTVVAVAPAFLKTHSYGEYVFDWAWADAWQRHGFNYYPKLLSAVPFTPATGPRLYLNPAFDTAFVALLEAISQFCLQEQLSGWHTLFIDEALKRHAEDHSLLQRQTVQFHWFNRDYADFDQFLATFSSRKRKNLRKERAAITQQGLQLTTRVGADIDAADWSFFHRCYQMTYAKRSGHGGYLTREFFTEVCPTLGHVPVMVTAHDKEGPVAAALYFQSEQCLFGRYWGCLKEYEFLHFEACYYRGIEFCIEQGIPRFDPGAQGEHKIQRGFEPVLTHSMHHMMGDHFQEALITFCQREQQQTVAYRDDARTLLPFKASDS